MRCAIWPLVLAACGATAPAAPVAVDVAPVPAPTMTAKEPPPNAARYIEQPVDGGSAPPFDKAAAMMALARVPLASCATNAPGNGPGHATITFEPSGRVASVVIDAGAAYMGTPTGDCAAHVFATVHVPPFSGDDVKVGRAFFVR